MICSANWLAPKRVLSSSSKPTEPPRGRPWLASCMRVS
ncbi:Uncharacterised protein [Bordetella pertussis]|nr:Uncharacterised protein [Bordetella pertussis]